MSDFTNIPFGSKSPPVVSRYETADLIREAAAWINSVQAHQEAPQGPISPPDLPPDPLARERRTAPERGIKLEDRSNKRLLIIAREEFKSIAKFMQEKL